MIYFFEVFFFLTLELKVYIDLLLERDYKISEFGNGIDFNMV